MTTKTTKGSTMNAQEIFDKVATHLFTQGKQAKDDATGGCMYRTKEGLSCAAGCLISDDDYDPKFEHRAFDSLFYLEDTSKLPVYLSNNKSLIRSLQKVHDIDDHWRSTNELKIMLNYEAERYGLSAQILDNLNLAA